MRNRQTTGPEGVGTVQVYGAYQQALPETKAEHIVAKPGDILPVKGMRVEVEAQ